MWSAKDHKLTRDAHPAHQVFVDIQDLPDLKDLEDLPVGPLVPPGPRVLVAVPGALQVQVESVDPGALQVQGVLQGLLGSVGDLVLLVCQSPTYPTRALNTHHLHSQTRSSNGTRNAHPIMTNVVVSYFNNYLFLYVCILHHHHIISKE